MLAEAEIVEKTREYRRGRARCRGRESECLKAEGGFFGIGAIYSAAAFG